MTECICNVGRAQRCPSHGVHPAVLEDLRANPCIDAGLNTLARRCGVWLFVGDPATVADPYGDVDASPEAQACKRGVCTLGLTPDCAYSVVHELAHILVGFGDEQWAPEARVLDCHELLASMLVEPFRSKAMSELTHECVPRQAGQGAEGWYCSHCGRTMEGP